MKILIIDDDSHWVELVTRYLDGTGYEVLSAMDGRDGISKIREHAPDLVLCDLCMPHGNGYDVVATCRRDPVLRGVFIVACTGSGLMDTDTMAKAVGFDGVLQKKACRAGVIQQVEAFLQRE